MKNDAVQHEEVLNTNLVKHKEELESITKCLKGIEQKFFKMYTKKEAWQAKSLSFEVEVQLLKEQKQNTLRASETCEKTLLGTIHDLDNQIQLVVVKEKEVAQQRETQDKHHVEMAKWKALTLEQSAKVVLYDQLLENHGEELLVVLTEA